MLEIGMTREMIRTVRPEMSAASMKSGLLEVLATPVMIAWMEECCLELVQSQLEPGQSTVGTQLDIRHESPTPVGAQVTILCRLEEIDGRKLTFMVEASDKTGMVGWGSHQRFIVDSARFQEKCDQKKGD